jgi:ATP-dependent helicase/nuclease subunit A
MLDDSIFLPVPLGSVFSDSADEEKTESVFDRENLESIKRRIELMRSSVADFDSLLEVNKKPTAAERGTATHEFLQFCDYENVDGNGIDAEIERLLKDRFITERTAKIIDRDRISGFFRSELYREIRKAKKIYREFRFGMFRPASDFTEDEGLRKIVESRTIFVQGSIDLIIERENGEILLCDYKTDRISAEQKADRARLITDITEKHGEQLKEYRNAVSSIFGRAPSKMYIYSVMLGDTVEINVP